MATIEDATRLGLAVEGFLARPPIDPLLNQPIPTEVLRQKIEMLLEYLETLDVLTGDERTSLQNYVQKGDVPHVPDGPRLTTGIALTSVALYLHDIGPGSLFGGMLPALYYVVDATMDGALHAGQDGALACASIATSNVLRGIKSFSLDVSIDAVTGIKSGIKISLGQKS